MLLRELITEGLNRYKPMFAPFYENGNIPPDVVAKMNDIERIMQRQDRVIWMMRWYRFYLHGYEKLPDDATPEEAKSYQSRMNKITKDVGAEDPESARADCESAMKLMKDFEHWFSLPITKMKNFVFERQSPPEIYLTFSGMEDEWINTRDRTVDMSDNDDAEKIIDFGNGWAWFNLNVPYCSEEGNAMGHCGNSAAYKTDDTVLSLREHVYEDLWAPHLTFILHDNGFLGEMKGRANEKPVQKYHKMIYQLLKSDHVNGITGGGYMARNNFDLNDLPRAEVEELKAEKWGFCDYHELKKAGRMDDALTLLNARSDDYSVRFDVENDRVIIEKYKSLDDYISDEAWDWEDIFKKVDEELNNDIIWYQFKSEYYHSAFLEHVYDIMPYVNEVYLHTNPDNSVEVSMSVDEFMSATDPDNEDTHGRDLDEVYDDRRDMSDIYEFSDDIDEALMELLLDRRNKVSMQHLLELIREKYDNDETKKYSFGSPTVKDRNQTEFDFN